MFTSEVTVYNAAAKNGSGSADNTERTSRCVDSSWYYIGVFTEPADKILCTSDSGECH